MFFRNFGDVLKESNARLKKSSAGLKKVCFEISTFKHNLFFFMR